MAKKYYDEHGNEVVVKKGGGGCLKWVAIIFGVLILIGACTMIFSDGDSSTSTDTATSQQETGQDESSSEESSQESDGELLQVGESKTIDDITLTVTDSYYTDERNEFDESNPDKVIAIEYTLENNSGEDYPFGLDTQVYADGKQMESYALGSDMGAVSSGRTVDGVTYYGVNGDRVELEWEPMFSFSGEKGIWDVTPQE